MKDESGKQPKTPRPVESFGSELLTALLRGATESVTIPMPYRRAIRFRQRIHQMREAMRRTGHAKYELCSKVGITIALPTDAQTVKSGRHVVPVDRDVEVRVTLSPNDSEFGPLLAAAGIKTPSDVAANTKPIAPLSSPPTLDALESMFGDIDKEDH